MTDVEPALVAVHTRSTKRRSWLAIGAVLAWTAVLLFGLLDAAAIQWMGDLGCEAGAGDSNYGTRVWSVAPPGPTCVYTQELNGLDRVDGPTPVMSIWVGGLVLGAVGCVILIGRARRT